MMMTNLLFKAIIVLAALSVVVLAVTAGYFVFTLKQVEKESQTAIPSSDQTSVLESELNTTSLEDFEADFQALQQEATGL